MDKGPELATRGSTGASGRGWQKRGVEPDAPRGNGFPRTGILSAVDKRTYVRLARVLEEVILSETLKFPMYVFFFFEKGRCIVTDEEERRGH